MQLILIIKALRFKTSEHIVRRAGSTVLLLSFYLYSAFVYPANAQGSASSDPDRAGMVTVELNKLEQPEGAESCRLYLLIDNPTVDDYQSLRMDLVFFGSDGVIARRLAVDAAPLRPKKRQVKLFDIAGLACAKLSQVLVNDILSCRDSAGNDRADCLDRIAVSSRVSAVAVTK